MTNWTERLAIVSDEAAHSFADAVEVCLPLGIKAYEIRHLDDLRFPYVSDQAIDRVLSIVNRRELTLIGVSPGFFKLLVDDPRAEAEFQEGFPRAFRLMDRLDVRQLTVFSYLEDERWDETPAQVIDQMGRAVTLCKQEGIELRIENGANCWGNTGRRLAHLAQAVDARVVWDPANAAAAGETAFPDGYQQVRDLIGLVHCKNWTPEAGNVPIHDGIVDIAAQIAALDADGYTGYYTVEPHQWHDRANAARLNTGQLLQILNGL
jgi:sugar phosphate isomerase/epimerase